MAKCCRFLAAIKVWYRYYLCLPISVTIIIVHFNDEQFFPLPPTTLIKVSSMSIISLIII